VKSESGTGEPGEEGVAFAGWDPKEPGRCRPADHSEQGSLQGDERACGIGPQIHHGEYGFCYRGREEGKGENAGQFPQGCKEGCLPKRQNAGGDHRGDGVGCIGPTIDEHNCHCNGAGEKSNQKITPIQLYGGDGKVCRESQQFFFSDL